MARGAGTEAAETSSRSRRWTIDDLEETAPRGRRGRPTTKRATTRSRRSSPTRSACSRPSLIVARPRRRDLRPAPEHRRPRRRDRQARRRRRGLDDASRSPSTSLCSPSYVALFRGVVGERSSTSTGARPTRSRMAGLAATRLFSAGGAGGIVLTYWALRKAGMQRRESASRMVAFLVLLYGVYLLAVIVFGVLLRTGVLRGPAPLGLTIVPAAIAGGIIILLALVALIPGDLERRIGSYAEGRASRSGCGELATVPATLSTGVRTAVGVHPRSLAAAASPWSARSASGRPTSAILWASFHGLRRPGAARRHRPGLLRRHGRQPSRWPRAGSGRSTPG